MSGAAHFSHATVAGRYDRDRPRFHPLVMERARQTIDAAWPVGRALDVACGTGQSATALRALARRVFGADLAPAMLRTAPRGDDLAYVAASAEALPFAAKSFDLATVALAFHWFDRERFLAEAGRVLRPGGWLVIYSNGFLGTMREDTSFARWCREIYLARYPSPPRRSGPLNADEVARAGFSLAGHERYTNDVEFTAPELVRYLLTQSNVIAAVEEGTETLASVGDWLRRGVTPFFNVPHGTFAFGGNIWYLRREGRMPDGDVALGR